MLDRIRTALVNSFTGAIAIGLLIAQGIAHVGSIVGTPLASWLNESYLLRESPRASVLTAAQSRPVRWDLALPSLVEAVVSLLAAYLLLRWLYLTPPETGAGCEPVENGEPESSERN